MDFNEDANRRQRLLDRQREKNMSKVREAEYARENLNKYLSKQSVYITAAEMDDNIELRRRKLDTEAIAREEALEALTRTAVVEASRRRFEQAQETALAHELEATRREEESRRMEIQRICEADPGLRELQVCYLSPWENPRQHLLPPPLVRILPTPPPPCVQTQQTWTHIT